MNNIVEELNGLYQLLPRANRNEFRERLLQSYEFNFVNGPNNSPAGRYFAIAVGDYPAPAAQLPLSDIIREIEPDNQEFIHKVTAASSVLREYLIELGIVEDNGNVVMTGGKNRSRRNRRSRRSRRNRRNRRNRRSRK